MHTTSEWVDLLAPTEDELRRAWPSDLHPQAMETLLQPHTHADEPRPKIGSHGSYAFAVLLVPVVVKDEDRVDYREVDMLLAHEHVLTLRQTPRDGTALDLSRLAEASRRDTPAALVA